MKMINFVVVLIALVLSGCEALLPSRLTGGSGTAATSDSPFGNKSAVFGSASADARSGGLYKQIPQGMLTTTTRKLAAQGIKALDERDFRKASDIFNLAVKTDISNSQLHLLNALAYHERALGGESALIPLAEQGYEQAVQFDSTNWVARYYRGLIFLDQRNYARAQASFAEAALYSDSDPDLLYQLAVASYYAKDPQTAASALGLLGKVHSGKPDDPRTLRAMAIVHAALNQQDEARGYLGRFRKVVASRGEGDLVEQRVQSWQDLYSREQFRLAQAPRPGAFPAQPGAFPAQPGVFPGQPGAFPGQPGVFPGQPGAFPGQPGAFPGQQGGVAGGPRGPSEFVEKQMVMVDVVILSTIEDTGSGVGVNLLQGLRLQFGNTAAATPAFSRTRNLTHDLLTGATNVNSTVITRLISIPAVNYSLNIANSNSHTSEVVARPTLVALGGQMSQFFAGTDIVGAAVSGGLGSSVQIQKEVGLRLTILPEFLPDGLIKLQVMAERTNLTIPSPNVVFDFRLDTTKTMVSANVVMRFGETVILSGLTETNRDRNRDGVPFLQDIPGIQFGFSRRDTTESFRSVLVLLTPRRAEYTNRSEVANQEERSKMTDEDRAVVDFNEKFRVKLKPEPNTAAIWAHLDTAVVVREFRAGDLRMQSWDTQKGHIDRLKQAIDLLYY